MVISGTSFDATYNVDFLFVDIDERSVYFLFISFIFTRNNIVESTLPCGTPASWSKQSEVASPSVTWNIRLCNFFLTKVGRCPVISL